MNNKKITKDEEEKISIIDMISNSQIINIFSPKLYLKIKCEKKCFIYSSKFKLLEKKENFDIIQYPKIELNDYDTIIIYGDNESNTKFLDGFLNFLYDIDIHGQYRLKLETTNNDKNLVDIRYINSQKGNFKIICINIEKQIYLDLKELEEFKKNLEKLNNEKYIDLLISNNTSQYMFSIEKLENKIFFCCPNNSFYAYKFMFLNKEMNLGEKCNNTKSLQDKLKEIIINIAELDEEIRSTFISCFMDFDSIFIDEISIDNIFRFNITMKGYKYLYDLIMERKNNYNNIDLSTVKKYISYLEKEAIYIRNKIKIYEEKKEEGLRLKEQKLKENKIKLDEYSKEKNVLVEKIKKTENEIYNIETILNNEKNILEIKSFQIPFAKNKEDKIYNDSKTNACKICKFNCHINCNHLIKRFCTGKKCKQCPNKCPLSAHEIIDYNYPSYDYKNFDIILKKHYGNENLIISNDLKIRFLNEIKNRKNELIINCDNLKEELKNVEEKEKITKEYNINEDLDFAEIIEMNNQINEEIELFNYKNFRENFDKEKLTLYSELFIFSLSNAKIVKDYTFIEQPCYSGGGGGGFRCCR